MSLWRTGSPGRAVDCARLLRLFSLPNSLFDCSVYPREFGLDFRYARILTSLESSTRRWYLASHRASGWHGWPVAELRPFSLYIVVILTVRSPSPGPSGLPSPVKGGLLRRRPRVAARRSTRGTRMHGDPPRECGRGLPHDLADEILQGARSRQGHAATRRLRRP